MIKKCLTGLSILFLLFVNSWARDHYTFYVEGRHLYDQCGEKVILRGIANPNIWFQREGLPQYTEIEKTGANVVRIVWETKGSVTQLDAAISNCIDLGMIPMIECHDATCNLDLLDEVVDYWTRSDIANIIIYHEEYLLLNIANESGDYATSAIAFRTAYEDAILRIRDAEIHVPLVIDGPDCGKNIDVLQSEGPYLISIDPDSNLLFSVHMWWNNKSGYPESKIESEIEQSINMNLPLIVGEFANWHDWEGSVMTPETAVPYLTIIEQCDLNEIGWIAWSWFGNNISIIDMTTDGTYETLNGWGLEVAVTSPYSIKNTSERPYSIVEGRCNPNSIENHEGFIHLAGFELFQNFPNPFNSGTQIHYQVISPTNITLEIYNIKGRKVKTLVHEWKSPGNYSAFWDGQNDSGEDVASDIYVCQITANRVGKQYNQSNKLILIK